MTQQELLPLLGKDVRALVSIGGCTPYGINGKIMKASHASSPIGICCDKDRQFVIGDNIHSIVRKPGFIVLLMLASGTAQPVFSDDNGLIFFSSRESAQAEIDEHINDVKEAVAKGHMDSEYTQDDYEICPAVLDGETITCRWEGDKYTMARTDDDWQYVDEPIDEEKLRQVRNEAEDAFWQVVADAYPDIKTGDFPPDCAIPLHFATENAIKNWLIWNKPSL